MAIAGTPVHVLIHWLLAFLCMHRSVSFHSARMHVKCVALDKLFWSKWSLVTDKGF